MLCYNNICKARCSEENSYFNFDLKNTVFDYSHQIMSEVQKTDTSDIDKMVKSSLHKKEIIGSNPIVGQTKSRFQYSRIILDITYQKCRIQILQVGLNIISSNLIIPAMGMQPSGKAISSMWLCSTISLMCLSPYRLQCRVQLLPLLMAKSWVRVPSRHGQCRVTQLVEYDMFTKIDNSQPIWVSSQAVRHCPFKADIMGSSPI